MSMYSLEQSIWYFDSFLDSTVDASIEQGSTKRSDEQL